jgi:hypothetical protein
MMFAASLIVESATPAIHGRLDSDHVTNTLPVFFCT